jgi:hypothetical protein
MKNQPAGRAGALTLIVQVHDSAALDLHGLR